MDPEKGDLQQPLLAECPPPIRAQFIRKVYGLLASQLLLTATIIAPLMLIPDARSFVCDNAAGVAISGTVASLITICPLLAYRNKHPVNLILLFSFTCFQAFVVGSVCAMYAERKQSDLVLLSVGTAALVFCVLSDAVHRSGRDFAFMETALTGGLFALMALSVFRIFVSVSFLNLAIAFFGIVVFCGLIMYDTSTMLHYMTPDDAVVASIQLYLDIINLFLYILDCLSSRN